MVLLMLQAAISRPGLSDSELPFSGCSDKEFRHALLSMPKCKKGEEK